MDGNGRTDGANVDLGGSWRAHASEGDLSKEFTQPSYDDGAWAPIDVPGHWRSTPAFADFDGPLLYRRTFNTVSNTAVEGAERRFLELDGCFYYGDVWLDGAYIGATEGYFAPHAFDVSEQLERDETHTLAIEVACPPQRDRTAKRTITGVFSHWDNLDPLWNPGGLWRPLRITTTGPLRIGRMRVLCPEASMERARLAVDVTVDAATDGEPPPPALLVATVYDDDGTLIASHQRDLALALGDNHLTFTIDVESPARWWPRRLGDQPRCRVNVEVLAGGGVSDRRSVVTALREVRFEDWTFIVNGERLFTMGSNQGPARMALAEATVEELRGDVDRAIDANLDLLRVHGHVTRPEFYDAADERGLLVWQDFPLQWGYARSVRRQAVRQARAMVDLLGHRPSVVLWCAHNEPLALDAPTGERMRPGSAVKYGASMFLPTWNKDVLDRSVARQIGRCDPTRPVVRHSGVLPSATSRGTDTHAYFGWYHGDMAGLAPALRTLPRLARYVSEFGAQAVPDSCDWMEPQRWPDLDWATLTARHALQRRPFDRYVPPEDCKSFDEWREATQAYQAALLQLQIEDLRRVKYAPTGGFAQFSFADGYPAVTWSVLDHERVPKRGYFAMRDACRPVLPMVEPREGLVHVVSERADTLRDATIEVLVDGHAHRFAGDVAADAVTFVGRVDLSDAIDVELSVEHATIGRITNRYPLVILDACRRR
ncbi:MAG: putative glycosidase [Actinomycetia bacterium]|nr:putative glycosidase [Actinomycetes bacterium]